MNTTPRSARKFAALAAGAALCLGAISMPAAQAADGVTVDPSAGWVEYGDSLTLSGSGCVGVEPAIVIFDADDNPAAAVAPSDDGSWSLDVGNIFPSEADSTKAGPGYGVFTVQCLDYADGSISLVTDYGTVTLSVIDIDSISGTTGEDTAVTARGFAPGEKVTFYLRGGKANLDLIIGEGVADSDGVVNTTVNVPTSVAVDKYDLVLVGDQGRTMTVQVTVGTPAEETPAEPGEGMPSLGTDVA